MTSAEAREGRMKMLILFPGISIVSSEINFFLFRIVRILFDDCQDKIKTNKSYDSKSISNVLNHLSGAIDIIARRA